VACLLQIDPWSVRGCVAKKVIKRLEKQFRFLLKAQQAELAKDATSHATESSRSNLIALQHTVKQIYGEAVVRHVGNLVTLTTPANLRAVTYQLKCR
jgi:hypothetical protein